MKLVSFTVEKYRSITKAHKIGLDKAAILVGPNNEGKSNILRALVTAMNVLTKGRRRVVSIVSSKERVLRTRFVNSNFYDWETDFPVHLQEKETDGESVMILEFEFTDAERQEFKKDVKSNLTGTLPLRIALSTDDVKVRVYSKGKGSGALTAKSDRIASFVADRLDFEHIPAVRTAQSAQRIVAEMVDRELAIVEENPEYKSVLQRVKELQQPVLDALSASIKETLVNFLPAVTEVKVQIAEEARNKALRRSCEIIIDDGAPTLLKYKGDGVQSLAALGIMRHASDRGSRGKNLVIAIEEPESHLHPDAIHGLRDVVTELSEKHQVVLTTHCPLFVNRMNISSNIIVHNKKARPAKSVEEIREILGVRASDNLRHAELVLVVEGVDDKIALEPLLKHASSSLLDAFMNGTLVIDTLGGGTNLAYKLGLISDALCLAHCFLDDDSCGRKAFADANNEGLIENADINFAICQGMSDAEIEDIYAPSAYESVIKNKFRVTLQSPKFKTSKKWSERMKDVFRQQGKLWDDKVESEVKALVAHAIVRNIDNALNPNKREAFDALVSALHERIVGLSRNRKVTRA